MKNNAETALNNFIGETEDQENEVKRINKDKAVLNERDGLIERFDTVLVDNKGRMLLREQY
jgi:ubiquinone biosynthesis protein Coq4